MQCGGPGYGMRKLTWLIAASAAQLVVVGNAFFLGHTFSKLSKVPGNAEGQRTERTGSSRHIFKGRVNGS